MRDKEKREVDFLLETNRELELLAEVKVSDGNLSPSLASYQERLRAKRAVQLVLDLDREADRGGIQIRCAASWLAEGLRR